MRGRRKSQRQVLLTEFVGALPEPERRLIHELAASALMHIECSLWPGKDAIRCEMVKQNLRAIQSIAERQPEPKEAT